MKVALILGTILVMVLALLFTKVTDTTPEKKQSVMVGGVPMDEELEMRLYRAWSPPIKAPHGTCIRWWNPAPEQKGNDFGVEVRQTRSGMAWISFEEFERKYGREPLWSWDEIRFAIAESNNRGQAVVKYKFVRQPCPDQRKEYAISMEQAERKPVHWGNMKSDGTVPVGVWGVVDIPVACQMNHEQPNGYTVEVYNENSQWVPVVPGKGWRGTRIRFMATELNLQPPTYKVWCQ